MVVSTSIRLKKGREASILRRHPWIFSQAVLEGPKECKGEIYPVITFEGDLLGYAYCHSLPPTIFGRMLLFGEGNPIEQVKNNLDRSIAMRQSFQKGGGVRWVHAEADYLPGLILDTYEGHGILQISTLGMEKLKPVIVESLRPKLQSLYEKSESPARKVEGLASCRQQIFGQTPAEIPFQECGVTYWATPLEGQKTGFFLDQRGLRRFLLENAQGKRVLNACSNTGSFSKAAMEGGAKKVVSVDISQKALDVARKMVGPHTTVCADVFSYLEQHPLPFDLVILDPPAFAKKRGDLNNALRAYRRLNRLALEKMEPNTMLVTCSCSHFVTASHFDRILLEASLQAKRDIRLIGKEELTFDHPCNLSHFESSYLKNRVVWVT